MALLSRKSRGLRLTARGVGRLATLAVAQVTVIERGLARHPQQEVGPPNRKLWVRRAR